MIETPAQVRERTVADLPEAPAWAEYADPARTPQRQPHLVLPRRRPLHMSDIQTAMAAAIRVRLTLLGMTQEALAQRVGMSTGALSARLNSRTLLDSDDFDTFAAALDLPDGWALIDLARVEHRSAAA